MAWNVLHSIEILTNTCRVVARRCIAGIKADRETCERYAYRTPSLATVLNPVIGYARAAEIVKKALASDKTIPEVCREEKVLSSKELDRLLDPHRMTEPGLPLRSRRSPR
jgi:aspartate ammonia-lyase